MKRKRGKKDLLRAVVNLRMTAALDRLAAKAGVSMSQYIRNVLEAETK